MEEIKLILMHSGTIPSIIIKKKTNYEYSHVVIAIDQEYKKLYSFGRKYVYNPFNGGLVRNGIDSDFFKKFNKCKCKVYKINITEKEYDKLQNVLNEFENNDEILRYDILGLFLRLFGIYKKRKNHYVCTQFVAEVLKRSNIYVFDKESEKVKPQDFEQITRLEKIYEGNFLDLKNK